jgi:hypothetical protein
LPHVLVSEQFETYRGFFHPTPGREIITTPDGRQLGCGTAEMVVTDLPLIRMRDGLSETPRDRRITCAEAVEAPSPAPHSAIAMADADHHRRAAGYHRPGIPGVVEPADRELATPGAMQHPGARRIRNIPIRAERFDQRSRLSVRGQRHPALDSRRRPPARHRRGQQPAGEMLWRRG